jgi:hypothetical protein
VLAFLTMASNPSTSRWQGPCPNAGRWQNAESHGAPAAHGRLTDFFIASDFTKLRGDYQDHEFKIAHVVDFGTMAVHRGVAERLLGRTTLQALARTSLGSSVPKPAHIRVGDIFDDQDNACELDSSPSSKSMIYPLSISRILSSSSSSNKMAETVF